jgi:hypothetical protein
MGKVLAANQKHVGQIVQPQLVAQPTQHQQHHDISGKLQTVERRARPLVECALTALAIEHSIV